MLLNYIYFGHSKPVLRKDKILCTYCDTIATTSDHVPPKLLFSKPRPTMITVPSCLQCNNGASLDDEYFRLVTSIKREAGNHPDAKNVSQAALRSLEKPNKKGFAQAFREAGRVFNEYSDSGIYLGKVEGIEVKKARLNRTIERVTRGLFLNCEGRRLDPSVKVTAYSTDGLSQQIKKREMFKKLWNSCGEIQSIGEDTFTWRYFVYPDQLDTSYWILQIYGAITFIAFTIGDKPLTPLDS